MRIFVAFSLLVLTSVFAQENLDRFKPKQSTPLAQKEGAPRTEGPVVVPSADRNAAGMKLRGIIFVAASPDIRAQGAPTTDGVQVHGVPMLDHPDFTQSIQKFVGQPLSLDLINAIATETARFFKQHDHPVVSVVAPEQDVTNGVVQLLVTEGRVGKVHVEGNQWFKSGLFKTHAVAGGPIIMSRLEADTAFYGRNPFRSVTAELSPGANSGETDITLRVQDKFPLRAFLGYENSGVETTGENRLFAGFNYGNLFGLGQEISYQFTTSDDFERLLAHSATWTVPLPWMHILQISGVYSESSPEIAEGFDMSGTSWQVGARYVIPLPNLGRIKHDLSLGYDFKFTDNNLQFGGTEVFDTPVEISEFSLAYSASRPDRLGSTSLSATAYWSPGGMSTDNDDEAFEAARQGSKADYYYFTGGVDRVTRLPLGLTWSLSAHGQWANGNLQSTEQFLLGGQSTVRGYDELVASGDSGLLMRNEVYSPAVSVGRWVGLSQLRDQLQFLIFHDWGATEISDPLEGEDERVELQSAGVGLRWQVRENVTVRFDYGWQIEDVGLEESSRAHLGVTVSL